MSEYFLRWLLQLPSTQARVAGLAEDWVPSFEATNLLS